MALEYLAGLSQSEADTVKDFCRQRGLFARSEYYSAGAPPTEPHRHVRVLVPSSVADAVRWLRPHIDNLGQCLDMAAMLGLC